MTDVDRRDFLRLGALMALGGLGACTRAPAQKILPYVEQPADVVPGVARRYATATSAEGYAVGLLVESHEGRPTKVEGNPRHPASLGASSATEQASVLSLYDPARTGAVRQRGALKSWRTLGQTLRSRDWTRAGGRGLHIVLEPTSSPTEAALIAAILARWPATTIHYMTPLSREGVRAGARTALGRTLEARLDLTRADVIVALDADPLGSGPSFLRDARHFADRRRDLARMNRLYVVEPGLTPTGMAADHRLALRRGQVPALAAGLAAALAIPELAPVAARSRSASSSHERWLAAVARDLRAHAGAALVVAGDAQPPEVHALAWAMNAALGSLGRTVAAASSPILGAGDPSHAPDALADALAAGAVDTLLVVGADIAYASPGDVPMKRLLGRATESFYVGTWTDDTAAACTWSAPLAHELESWSDARAFDGTASIVQPLIAPLTSGRTPAQVLACVLGDDEPDAHALVRATWSKTWSLQGAAFEERWEDTLAAGVAADTALPAENATVAMDRVRAALEKFDLAPIDRAAPLELTLSPDARLGGGRFAHNAWLLELPDPVTKLTWENAAVIAPATAKALGLETGHVARLRVGDRAIEVPAFVSDSQAEGSIGLALGWGRAGGDPALSRLGVNAFPLASRRHRHAIRDIVVANTGEKRELPITQPHRDMDEHERTYQIYRFASLAKLMKDPDALRDPRRLQLYARLPDRARQWGMTVDLGACTGCSACVVACQAENNVPVVGREGIVLGRAMHWLRIDTYSIPAAADAQVPQPMLCQHCELAPCEYVCPVNATVHSGDGLNEMVYNRCIGTRFCSNNCPYKVRRFNWFDYHQHEAPSAKMQRNPEVTVRERGVMEKCTFCVQRIRNAENTARAEGRELRDGEIQTACQQACPTRAIVFGDIADARSEVARLHESPRAFGALEELGTRPRVRYLARIRNLNEELA